MDKKIYEPILVYVKDTSEIIKYETLCSAEIDLESYDIDNYEAYDAKYRKLKIIPSKKGGVNFVLEDEKVSYQDIIFEYICNEIKSLYLERSSFKIFDELINILPSIKYKC